MAGSLALLGCALKHLQRHCAQQADDVGAQLNDNKETKVRIPQIDRPGCGGTGTGTTCMRGRVRGGSWRCRQTEQRGESTRCSGGATDDSALIKSIARRVMNQSFQGGIYDLFDPIAEERER